MYGGSQENIKQCSIWGDCGRYPLLVQLSKQVFNYFDRLSTMDRNNSNAIVRQTFCEQRTLKLPWYRRLTDMKEAVFNLELRSTASVNFLCQKRTVLKQEPGTSDKQKARILQRSQNNLWNGWIPKYDAQLYGNQTSGKIQNPVPTSTANNANPISRVWWNCSNEEKDVLLLLIELPSFEPIVEDEQHVFTSCSLYNDIREKLKPETKAR